MLLVLVGGCGGWRNVPLGILGGRDGDWTASDDGFRVVVVDGWDRLDPTSMQTIRSRQPDRLAVRDLVARSTPRRWRQSLASIDGLAPVWPTVGEGERRRDRSLRGFYAAWPDVGIPMLSEPVPWYAVDVQTGDVRWRWLVCDSHAAPLGRQWLDERSWVPKAVSDRRVDRVIVALDAGPSAAESAAVLLDLVRAHTSAESVVLVVAFGTGRPGFVPVGGRWGEGRLTPAPLPSGGWWVVDLDEAGLTLTAERPLGAPVVHTWSPGRGWANAP